MNIPSEPNNNGVPEIFPDTSDELLIVLQNGVCLAKVNHVESTLNITNRKWLVTLVKHKNKSVI